MDFTAYYAPPTKSLTTTDSAAALQKRSTERNSAEQSYVAVGANGNVWEDQVLSSFPVMDAHIALKRRRLATKLKSPAALAQNHTLTFLPRVVVLRRKPAVNPLLSEGVWVQQSPTLTETTNRPKAVDGA